MSAVLVRCATMIDRAAPSLMPALDITHSTDGGVSFWELWDPRKDAAPRVAKYCVKADGTWSGGVIFEAGDLVGMAELNDFLEALRKIEAAR